MPCQVTRISPGRTDPRPTQGGTLAVVDGDQSDAEEHEHFKPTGTIFLLVCFVAALILLWLSVYLILVSRGVTV